MTHEEYVERFDEYVRLIDHAYEAGDHKLWKAAIEMCLKHGPDAMRGHERLSPEKLKEMRGPLTMLVQEIMRSTGPIKSLSQ